MMETKTILIVEDEAIVARDIENKLADMGFKDSEIVSTGEDAIKKAKELNILFILMDITLRGDLSGIDAVKEIKTFLDVPIFYLTAFSDKKTLNMAKVTEPCGYILKPLAPDELVATIEIGLYRHEFEKSRKIKNKQYLQDAKNIKKIFEFLEEMIFIIDQDLTIQSVNSTITKKLGYTKESLIGKPISDLVVEHENINDFNLSLDVDDVLPKETYKTFIGNDGRETSFLVSARMISVEPESNKIVYSCLEVPDSSKNNENRKDFNKELARISYVTSYRLKSPVEIAQSFVNFLHDKHEKYLDQECQDFLAKIENALKKVNPMLDSFVTYSMVCNYSDFNETIELNDVVKSVIAKLKIEAKYVNFEISYDSLLPVKMNKVYTEIIFNHLLHNSIQHSKEGMPVEITITSVAQDNYIEISIQDNGTGIEKDFQDKIFEPFVKVNNDSGSGMGLTIVRRAIWLSGGDIKVSSEVGKGTTFTFNLPKAISLP